VNKQVYYLAVQAAALIVNLALNMVFIRLGYGLSGVALAAATTYFLYTCALVITAYFVYKFE
jgi:Na+-driven multidrug efflux pump